MSEEEKEVYYEKTKYKCKRCGELKVRKKIGSRYTREYCDDCLPLVKKKSMTAAARKRHDTKYANLGHNETLPDGSIIKLKDKHEKEYFVKFRDRYLRDFKCDKSSDEALLSNLLSLAIQAHRIEASLYSKTSEASIRNLSVLAREIRQTQEALGITRQQRESAGKGSLIDRFNVILDTFIEYKKNNIGKFETKCPKCGEIFAIDQEPKLFTPFREKKVAVTPNT